MPSTTTFENQAFEKPVSKEQVATFLQKLDDAIIFRMINGRDITLEDIKDMAPKVQIPN